MTQRLYYDDCYLQSFDAQVVEATDGGRRVYLDRTAFYPTSGGQLFDLGTLGGIAITDVIDEGERIAHVLASPLNSPSVHGEIDWSRRYDFMQQHTGQHLLSAVVEEVFGWKTISVHMGVEGNTVDVDAPSVTEDQLAQVERRCLQIITQARPVMIGFEENAAGLRKESQRTGALRIVSIDSIDRSACGGTHVRSTSEIGLVLTGKTEKIRGITRIEFACGARALARARSDNQHLANISRSLSVAPDQASARIASLIDQNKSLDKERLRLAAELAKREGQELYAATTPDANGIRRARHDGPIDDATRTRAQAFIANPKAIFLAVSTNPSAILLAASQDSGIHAGEKMKAALAAVGGRGGGNAQLAQGSVPDAASLEKALALLQ